MRTKQEQEPAASEVAEVGPGIVRTQLPIRMPGLGHVNMYLLLDDRGAAVVDAGVPGPTTWKALQRRLKDAGLRVGDVHTVLVTHSHPDHFGCAGRLAAEADADLVTHSAFRTWFSQQSDDCAEQEVHDVEPEDLAAGRMDYRAPTPWGGQSFRGPARRRLMFRLMRSRMARAWAPPAPTQRLRNGETLKLAGREWQAVHTPGHTLDHLCLYDPEAGVLLSGDHVLPTITPHVSGLGTGRDPLKAFVASLDRVAALPGVRTVLPAHGHPFNDLVARVDDIKQHHVERLDRLIEAMRTHRRASVTDLSHELFRRARWGPMAESETYAHLEHLRLDGRAERHEEHGLLIYELSG